MDKPDHDSFARVRGLQALVTRGKELLDEAMAWGSDSDRNRTGNDKGGAAAQTPYFDFAKAEQTLKRLRGLIDGYLEDERPSPDGCEPCTPWDHPGSLPRDFTGWDFTGCSTGLDGEDGGVLVDPRFNPDLAAGAEATGADLRDTTFVWTWVRWVDPEAPNYDEEAFVWEECGPGEGTKVALLAFDGRDGDEVIAGWAAAHESGGDRG